MEKGKSKTNGFFHYNWEFVPLKIAVDNENEDCLIEFSNDI